MKNNFIYSYINNTLFNLMRKCKEAHQRCTELYSKLIENWNSNGCPLTLYIKVDCSNTLQ